MFSALASAVSGRGRGEEIPLLPRDVEAGSGDDAVPASIFAERMSRGRTAGTSALETGEREATRGRRGAIALVSILAVTGVAGYSVASASVGGRGAHLGAAGTRTRPDRWVDAGAETRATHRPSALESVNPWSKRDTDGLKLTARVAAPESKRGAVMAGQWGASRERRRPGKKSVKPRRAAARGDDEHEDYSYDYAYDSGYEEDYSGDSPGEDGPEQRVHEQRVHGERVQNERRMNPNRFDVKARRRSDSRAEDDGELVPVLGDQVVRTSTPAHHDSHVRSNQAHTSNGGKARACVLKNAATEEQAQAVLDFACGRVSCAPIGWGGAKEFPNTRVDHAAWAIDRYFRLRSREPDAFPQRDCHFVGVATLDVPNNFYLASNGELVQTNHRTDVIARKVTVPSEGIVFNSGTSVSGRLVSSVGSDDPLRPAAGASTAFKYWVGANRVGAGGDACMVETTVVYDFDGDGEADRTESFELQGVPSEPDLLPVETKVLGHSVKARGARFPKEVSGARVSLMVRSPNCPGEIDVWESAATYPSFLTVPYR
jgi:hypothetical protein